jgi:RNA polymerase sigma factor (sigma-70 family)
MSPSERVATSIAMTDSLRRFEDLVARHQGAVCAVAYAVLRDRAQSEEIAQEAFLVAWQKLPGMDPAPALPGWVCGIARNLARNAARRRKETEMSTEPVSATTPLDTLIDREAEAHASRALAALSEAERDVVVLYYRSDESLGSVASALGITEAAAKKRLARGREHLRAALAPVEAALRGTRPGAAFTAACVAAMATRGGGAEAASEPAMSTAAKLALAGAAVVAVTAATWGVARVVRSPSAASVRAAAVTAPVGVATTSDADAAAWTTLSRPIAPNARTTLAARIAAARVQRVAAAGGSTDETSAPREMTYDFSGGDLFAALPGPTVAPHTPGVLSKKELRDAIHSVQPLLVECYTANAATLDARPGVIQTQLRMEGEPDVGTLVTAVTIAGDDHLAGHADLAECFRETLLSVELPPLDGGGIVNVHYPFTVRPDR